MNRIVLAAIVAAMATPALSGCGNTIRGLGQDTANTVDATQNATRRTTRAVTN